MLRKFSLVRALLMVSIAYPAIKYFDIFGAAITPLLAMCLAYGMQLHTVRILTGLSARRYLAVFGRAAIISAVPVLSWLILEVLLHEPASWIMIASTAAVTASLYAGFGAMVLFNEKWRSFFWPFEPRYRRVSHTVAPTPVAIAD
jgi:hypothetical protein